MPGDHEILDAALQQFRERGITRTTADDIARQAGVNRTTLYRRFGSKDGFVRAAILLEVSRTMAEIKSRADAVDGYPARLTEGFVVAVRVLRSHPLLRRALTIDRSDSLEQLTIASAGILELATDFVLEMVAEAKAGYGVPPSASDPATAALLVRLLHSLVLIPDAPPRLRTTTELRQFAREQLVPLFAT
jgi:AcrR family transcriptional regulator